MQYKIIFDVIEIQNRKFIKRIETRLIYILFRIHKLFLKCCRYSLKQGFPTAVIAAVHKDPVKKY
jgi:hypothetical protein